jgi:predicted dehydrogenase
MRPLINAQPMKPNSISSRRSFLKTLGVTTLAAPFVTSNLIARPPHKILRHASFGAAGMAGADIQELARFANDLELVAVAEVDLGRAAELVKRFPQVRVYQDWRELLQKEGKHLDSVNVSTPDHMHALMAMSAMEMGKHVYVQKPLAHDLYEVRKLTQYARQHNKKIVTQMGIQIHSSSHYRLASILIRANTIGKIKEVHSW